MVPVVSQLLPVPCKRHIAYPSSMQDACDMNFVIDLALRGVFMDQWLEHRSAESEGLWFDSSWGLRIFFLSHASDKTKKKHLSLFLQVIELKTYHISYFYLMTNQFKQTGLRTFYSLDYDDDFRSGCKNVSHHYRQQSLSGIH